MTKKEYVQSHLGKLERYIDAIINDETIVSVYEKKTVQYYLRLRHKYDFRQENLVKLLRFFFYLNQPTRNGIKQIEIIPFQMLWLSACVCLYYPNTNKRVITRFIASCAKKNNKTGLIALLALDRLLGITQNETLPKIVVSANSKSQALLLIKQIGEVCTNSPLLQNDRIEVWKSKIVYKTDEGDCIITNASTDSKTIQGNSINMSVTDEFLFLDNTDTIDKLATSQANVNNPLQILISTAGDDKTSDSYKLMAMGKNILDGSVENDSTFCACYELDNPDEANLLTTSSGSTIIRKSNPAISYTVTEEQLLSDYNRDKHTQSSLMGFKRDRLNLYGDDIGFNQWCDLNDLKSCMRQFDDYLSGSTGCDVLTGESLQYVTNKIVPQLRLPIDSKVVVAVDFSSSSDLTSIHIQTYVKEVDSFLTENIVMLPTNEKAIIRNGGFSFQRWIDNGTIIQCNSPTLNPLLVIEIFKTIKNRYNIEVVGYDHNHAGTHIMLLEDKLGLYCQAVPLNMQSLGMPLTLVERYIAERRYLTAPNSCLLYQAKNVWTVQDGNANKKIIKNKCKDSVDSWFAANISMNVWLRDNQHLFLNLIKKN